MVWAVRIVYHNFSKLSSPLCGSMWHMRGRPPKPTNRSISTITLKVKGDTKNRIVALADGYGMTITEYLLTLVERDASQTS